MKELLEKDGWIVYETWSHEFSLKGKSEYFEPDEVNQLWRTLPLNPQSAYKGGKVGLLHYYYAIANVDKSENTIVALDVNSLYPFVLHSKDYPVGTWSSPPIEHGADSKTFNPDANFNSYYLQKGWFGVIMCEVLLLPRPNYVHPLDNYTAEHSLRCFWCSACMDENAKAPVGKRSSYCSHSVEERCIRGNFTTIAIDAVISEGAGIIKAIYGVVHFDKRSREVNRSYITAVNSIKETATKTGATGTRNKAKLLGNGIYGKYGEGDVKKRYYQVNCTDALIKLLENPHLDHTHTYIMPLPHKKVEKVETKEDTNEEVYDILDTKILLTTQPLSAEAKPPGNANIYIAAFTTSYAREVLRKGINTVLSSGGQMLYFDTDSIVAVVPKNKKDELYERLGVDPVTLGAWKDETKDKAPNCGKLAMFASTAPKEYVLVSPRYQPTMEMELMDEYLKQNNLYQDTQEENKALQMILYNNYDPEQRMDVSVRFKGMSLQGRKSTMKMGLYILNAVRGYQSQHRLVINNTLRHNFAEAQVKHIEELVKRATFNPKSAVQGCLTTSVCGDVSIPAYLFGLHLDPLARHISECTKEHINDITTWRRFFFLFSEHADFKAFREEHKYMLQDNLQEEQLIRFITESYGFRIYMLLQEKEKEKKEELDFLQLVLQDEELDGEEKENHNNSNNN